MFVSDVRRNFTEIINDIRFNGGSSGSNTIFSSFVLFSFLLAFVLP